MTDHTFRPTLGQVREAQKVLDWALADHLNSLTPLHASAQREGRNAAADILRIRANEAEIHVTRTKALIDQSWKRSIMTAIRSNRKKEGDTG